MRDKVWKNCPSCGSENSMNRSDKLKFESKKHHIHLKNLHGYTCKVCHDGVFDTKSNNLVQAEIYRVRALRDAEKVPAAQLMLIADAAKRLHVTKQAIHKMMKQGRLGYVFVAGTMMLPRKDAVLAYKKTAR